MYIVFQEEIKKAPGTAPHSGFRLLPGENFPQKYVKLFLEKRYKASDIFLSELN